MKNPLTNPDDDNIVVDKKKPVPTEEEIAAMPLAERLQRGRQVGASGVRTGIESLGMGDIPVGIGRGVGWLAGKFHDIMPDAIEGPVSPEEREASVAAASKSAETVAGGPQRVLIKALELNGIISPETAAQLLSVAQPTQADVASVTDPIVSTISPEAQEYTRTEPGNFSERAAFEIGAFLPGLATGGTSKAATLPSRFVEGAKTFGTRVAAPALASETAGTAAHEYAPEYEPLIRMVTAAATGSFAAAGEKAAVVADAARQLKTSPAAMQRVVSDLERSGMTVDEALKKVDDMGKGTVLMDVNPNLLQEGQRIVAKGGGPGRGTITERLGERTEGTAGRVKQEIGEELGPATSPEKYEAGIKTEKEALSPEYEAALEGPGAKAIDTTEVSNNIESAIANEVGEAQTALKKVRDMLRIEGTEHLDPLPRKALKTRRAIDGMIDSTDDGNVIRVLTEARRALDEQLGVAVPGIKEVDAKYAKVAQKGEAFEEGRKSLQENSKWPSDIEEDIATRGAHVEEGMREGMRSKIESVVGHTGYNAIGLKKAIRSDGSYNREKLEILFGKEKADRVAKMLDRETEWQRTHVRTTEQSPTAERGPEIPAQDRADLLRDVGVATAVGGPTGFASAVVSNIGRAALDKFRRQRAIARDAEVADLLSSPEPTKVLQGIQLAQKKGAVLPQTMVNALLSRQFNKDQ